MPILPEIVVELLIAIQDIVLLDQETEHILEVDKAILMVEEYLRALVEVEVLITEPITHALDLHLLIVLEAELEAIHTETEPPDQEVIHLEEALVILEVAALQEVEVTLLTQEVDLQEVADIHALAVDRIQEAVEAEAAEVEAVVVVEDKQKRKSKI